MTAADENAGVQDKMLAMNEALLLGAVRQHELAEAANSMNARLQAEIHDRIRAEEELRRAQAQLKDRAGQLEQLVAERTAELTATTRQMETFIYSIAHDLRAPLRAMQGFSAMLVNLAGEALGEPGKSYAERINKSALHMDAMLIDLLAFSRVSQQHLDPAPVDMAAVVESVLADWQTQIQEKNARVELSGPWPVVLAHEATLGQVLGNLVGNALKFVSANAPPFVRVWTEEKEGWTRVWVEDHGPGIDARYQARIFELFIRLDGTKYPGTGVGLAIVKKGVERMGGRLGVESVPGEGSRFWFELPHPH